MHEHTHTHARTHSPDGRVLPYNNEDATIPHWSALLSAMLMDINILFVHIRNGHAAVENISSQPDWTYVVPLLKPKSVASLLRHLFPIGISITIAAAPA